MKTLFPLFLVMLILVSTLPLQAAGQKQLLEDLNTAAKDSVNSSDLETLSKTIAKIYEKYKFSDSDIEKLCTQAVTTVFTISDYLEKLKTAGGPGAVQPPRSEVTSFFTSLTGFVKKYKITGDDTLTLARDITLVTLSAREKEKSPQAAKDIKPTKEDMTFIFSKLIDFSKAHKVQTEDLMPIMSRLGDMALSALQNEEEVRKLEKTDPEKAKELARSHGITQDQVMALINSLMAFQKIYKIDLAELFHLADDIRKKL